MSSREFSGRRAALAYRQGFPSLWSGFLRRNFDSPAEVAALYGVDPTTAENWWDARTGPSGFAVAWTLSDPELGARAAAELRTA